MSYAEQVQYRNICKTVKALADLCFGSQDHPKYGNCWVAIVNSLSAKDGLDWQALHLEPLPKLSLEEHDKALIEKTQRECLAMGEVNLFKLLSTKGVVML
jgi:hypothetical protein